MVDAIERGDDRASRMIQRRPACERGHRNLASTIFSGAF
jgi:hypothetical protein